jgi:aminoglycoside phosphotransferase (APT) family kinase protein
LPELDNIWNWESFLDSGRLTCLLHGDSWNNNLLFRYPSQASEKPEEMLLIDWQIARCGHPSHDLGYFLFSSTSSSFRRQHLDELLNEYYETLSNALMKLDIDLSKEGYSQEQFIRETKQRYILMMMIALFILPILLDSAKAIDHTLKNDENLNKDLNELLEKGKWFAFSKSMKMCSSLQSIDNN